MSHPLPGIGHFEGMGVLPPSSLQIPPVGAGVRTRQGCRINRLENKMIYLFIFNCNSALYWCFTAGFWGDLIWPPSLDDIWLNWFLLYWITDAMKPYAGCCRWFHVNWKRIWIECWLFFLDFLDWYPTSGRQETDIRLFSFLFPFPIKQRKHRLITIISGNEIQWATCYGLGRRSTLTGGARVRQPIPFGNQGNARHSRSKRVRQPLPENLTLFAGGPADVTAHRPITTWLTKKEFKTRGMPPVAIGPFSSRGNGQVTWQVTNESDFFSLLS